MPRKTPDVGGIVIDEIPGLGQSGPTIGPSPSTSSAISGGKIGGQETRTDVTIVDRVPVEPDAPPRQNIRTRTAFQPPRQTPQDFAEVIWSGDRAPLSIIYGRARVRCFPVTMQQDGSNVVFLYVVGLGEIQEIEDVYVNSQLFDGGSSPTDFTDWEVNTYTGTGSQTADPLLQAAITGSPAYADALDGSDSTTGLGTAYVVLKVPVNGLSGLPFVEVIAKGRKVTDPRTSPPTTAYSANPALILRDIITDSDYGWGKAVDDDTVAAAADACDELVNSSDTRREMGFVLYDPQEITRVVDQIAEYAAVYLSREGDTLRMVPDRPRSSDLSLNDKTHIVASQYERKPLSEVPEAVEVSWYDVDAGEEKSVRAPNDDAANQIVRYRLNGITSYSQAKREATERYNRLRLEDLSGQITVAGRGFSVQVGDVVTVTDRIIAIEDKDFRVVGGRIVEPGVFRLSLVEYVPAVYSDDVSVEPVGNDTTLPEVQAPPDPPKQTLITETNTGFVARGKFYRKVTLQADPSDNKTQGFLYRLENSLTDDVDEIYAPTGEDVELINHVGNGYSGYSIRAAIRSVGFNGLISDFGYDGGLTPDRYSIATVISSAPPGANPSISANTTDKTLLVELTQDSVFVLVSVEIYRTDVSPEELIYTVCTTSESVLFYYDKLASSQSYRAEVAPLDRGDIDLNSTETATVST